jgi:HEAT repeat protein
MRRTLILLGALAVLLGGGLLLWRLRVPREVVPAKDTPQSGTPESAQLQRLIHDSLWQRRAAAGWAVSQQTDLPVARRVELLLDLLDREIATPTQAPPVPGSWPPFTNTLRLHYLHAIETLGPEARGAVRGSPAPRNADAREWRTLALGAAGDHQTAPALTALLANSADPDVRMTAARYLGWLNDRSAVPALKAALRDTATAMPVSDMRGRKPQRFYPVREQAAAALEDLGLPVTRTGDTFTAP